MDKNKIIENYRIAEGESVGLPSPLLYRVARKNPKLVLNHALDTVKCLSKGRSKTPERVRLFLNKIPNFGEFKRLVNGMVPQKNEPIISQ